MNIDALATLKHLNIRKEGDDKVLAIDLKLEVEIDSDVLIEIHPSLRATLWRDDEPRFAGVIESVALVGTLRHHTVTCQKVTLRECSLAKLNVTPLPKGRVLFAFTATSHPDSGRVVALLSEFVAERVDLQVVAEAALLSGATNAEVTAAVERLAREVEKGRRPNAAGGEVQLGTVTLSDGQRADLSAIVPDNARPRRKSRGKGGEAAP